MLAERFFRYHPLLEKTGAFLLTFGKTILLKVFVRVLIEYLEKHEERSHPYLK